MKIFNNPTKAVILILLVILMFLSYKAKATEVEFGATYSSEFNGGYALSLMERFGDNIDVGITLVGEQKYNDQIVENNGAIWLAFIAKRPENWYAVFPSEVTIGAAHWVETNRFIGCQQGYTLGLKWFVWRDASIGIRHFSNAGICKPNRGQDILTFGWRFK